MWRQISGGSRTETSSLSDGFQCTLRMESRAAMVHPTAGGLVQKLSFTHHHLSAF